MGRFTTARRNQRGATLVVGLVMLVLATLIVLASFRLGFANLAIVGNAQNRNESIASAQQAIEVVRQGVVDRSFHVAAEIQRPVRSALGIHLVVRAVRDVVLQHLGLPGGKGLFAGEMGHGRVGVGPGVAPLAADLAG